jgi:D-alanyl-D-alanine carboxypeptidase
VRIANITAFNKASENLRVELLALDVAHAAATKSSTLALSLKRINRKAVVLAS